MSFPPSRPFTGEHSRRLVTNSISVLMITSCNAGRLTYEHGALLFLTERQQEYVAYRKRMLATDLDSLANWQVHAMLRMALLAPVEAELASQLKVLARRSLGLAGLGNEQWS